MLSASTSRTASLVGAGAVLAGSAALFASSPAAAEDDTATVSVLHGVPGVTVDVFANGHEFLPDFTPGTLTQPRQMPAGTYDIAVYKDGEGPGSVPVMQADVNVPKHANATLVAHLGADGRPMLSSYLNDTAPIPDGQARLTVRHDAAAPAVDVRAGGTPVVTGLTNPNEAKADVPAGTVQADVVLAGTGTVVLGPAQLPLPAGTNTIVYAYGSAADGTLAVKTQQVTPTAPSGMPGEGSPKASAVGGAGAAPAWAVGLGAAAALGLAAGAYRASVVRR